MAAPRPASTGGIVTINFTIAMSTTNITLAMAKPIAAPEARFTSGAFWFGLIGHLHPAGYQVILPAYARCPWLPGCAGRAGDTAGGSGISSRTHAPKIQT